MKSDIGVSFIEMFALTPNVLDIGQHFHEDRFAFLLASRAGGQIFIGVENEGEVIQGNVFAVNRGIEETE